jgi:hypothetical protein
MKIFKHCKSGPDYVKEVERLVYSQEYAKKLIAGHGFFPEEDYDSDFQFWLMIKITNQLLPIYNAMSGNFSGQKILDLGCGSPSDTYESKKYDPKKYEPWLCRVLLELGTHPIGIDMGNLETEKFEHYSLNFLVPDSLSFLGDASIDVAHVDLLFDSPSTPEEMHYDHFKKILIPQLERIVKSDGFYIEGG